MVLSVLLTAYISNAQSTIHVSSLTQSLKAPIRLAIDNSDKIYVTDAMRKNIAMYDISGNFLGTITPGGYPISIAINDANEIFIGDGENGNISKLDANGVAHIFYAGTLFPSSMTFSPDGLLYVVDSKQNQVIVLDQTGSIVQTIGAGTLIYPTGIAYDNKNNRILVSEHGGVGTGFNPIVKIWIFDLQGNLINNFGSHGSGDGQFYRIQGITVGRCGIIFVPDPFQGNVSIFNENGDFITKFGEYGESSGQLNLPLDILTDSQDRILITSMNNGSIEVFDVSNMLPSPIPQFSYTSNNLDVTFSNSSIGAASYLWNFGDGVTSSEINPVHSYQANGEYIVTLTATNVNCGDSTINTSILLMNVQADNINLENNISIYPNPSKGNIIIESNKEILSDFSIEITNITGQRIYFKIFSSKHTIEQIDLTGFSKGIYTVKLISMNSTKTTKLILIN